MIVGIRGFVDLDMVSEEGGGGYNSSIKVISDSRACFQRLDKVIQNLDESWQW